MSSGWVWVITILTAASLLLGIANTIWTWLSKGGAAISAKLKQMEEKLIGHDRRIQTIEGELKHLPNKEDVHELRLLVTEIKGQLNTADAELAAVTRTVRRIEDHLLGERQ